MRVRKDVDSLSGMAWFPPALLFISAIIEYVGASLAVRLFDVLPVGAVAWGRIAVAAVILMAWRRPKIPLRELWKPILFGIVLCSMNVVFYGAISHIPLGTAVALEYLGPIALAALTGRGWRIWAGVISAGVGVYLISWIGVDMSDPNVRLGMGLAVLAGILWATYMVLARKIAVGSNSIDTLAVAFLAGAIVYSPLAIPEAAPMFTDIQLLLTMIAVGVFSSVIPFVLDLFIMRTVDAGTFALLSSLLPATSFLVGIVMLGQIPNVGQVAGLVCITLAVALATHPEASK